MPKTTLLQRKKGVFVFRLETLGRERRQRSIKKQ